jgi:hypothetical protein
VVGRVGLARGGSPGVRPRLFLVVLGVGRRADVPRIAWVLTPVEWVRELCRIRIGGGIVERVMRLGILASIAGIWTGPARVPSLQLDPVLSLSLLAHEGVIRLSTPLTPSTERA